ncbi:response regulator transcription factor [Robinsoniella peoriensis]
MRFKVVVIDDKPLIRRSLIETIQWEVLGCEIAGEAENGLEAKEVIRKVKPHLIISDIKMPGLDGLSLTEFVKEFLPDSKVIIITGYQEFEYAKKAIQLGVCDLVLKPIDNGAMEVIIQKAIDSIREQLQKEHYQRQLLEENDRYKMKIGRSLKALQSQFLMEVIKGRRSPDRMDADETVNLHLGERNFSVILARIRSSDQQVVRESANVAVKLMEHFKEACDMGFVDLMVDQDLVFIAFHRPGKSAREHRVQMKRCLYAMNDRLLKEQGSVCCFAVSRITNDVAKLEECYKNTVEILNQNYFTAEENILFQTSAALAVSPDTGYLLKELNQFYTDLEHMEDGERDQKVVVMVEKIVQETKGDEFRIKCMLSEICITLLRHYSEKFHKDDLKKNTNKVMEEINGFVDIRDAREYLVDFIREIRKHLKEENRLTHPLAQGTMDYIRQNYKQNITLTQVADTLSVNSSYLSRLLKKETGENFVDLLAGFRIDIAKRLLDEPGSKVLDVCEKAGYSDYAYFYQVFKRVEKISPSEYKKRGKRI